MDVGAPSAATTVFGPAAIRAEQYAALLRGPGVERGLLGPGEGPRVWDRHILNSAVIQELLPFSAEVADLGSGAGLPGIPVALARPDVSMTLVEPMLRRVAFLEEAVQALGLTETTRVQRSRAEDLAGRLLVDCVVARAVAPMSRLIPLALPLLRPGGLLLALKGSRAEAEISEVRARLQLWNARSATIAICGRDVLPAPATVVRVDKEDRPRRRSDAS